MKALMYLWQLPQNILGIAYMAILKMFKKLGSITVLDKVLIDENLKDKDLLYILKRNSRGCVSLGRYIFMSPTTKSFNTTMSHEIGHTRQSKKLGWLYLIVIGIPSILWAGLRRMGLFQSKSYYWFYTEAWADKLAGSKRNK